MYNPSSFTEDRIEILHSFIRQHPLATIVTCSPDGPEATQAPVVLHADIGAHGILRCHFARANPHWKTLSASTAVLAIFHGPEHYITPSWYPSKREHGKVVPTWDYVTVHVHGRATLFEDPQELRSHLRALVDQSESALGTAWSIDDAPADFIEGMSKSIVGIEIAIDSLEGKWKVSQNRSQADRQGVVAGLRAIGSPASIEMAEMVEQRFQA